MTPTKTIALSLLASALAFAACASEPDDICIAERKLGVNGVSLNGVSLNGVSLNKLGANGLFGEELPGVALTSASIAEAFEPGALDELTLDVLAYTVSCALAPEQSVDIAVDGDVRTFEGALGLAPQWGDADGECDATCQGWVSSCLIARTNFKGESVAISLLGDHAGLDPSADESIAFAIEEATYFGDLFGDDRGMYACLPAGESKAVRTCGNDTANCPISVVGACDDVCDAAGCRNGAGQLFAETITVNVRDAAASCD